MANRRGLYRSVWIAGRPLPSWTRVLLAGSNLGPGVVRCLLRFRSALVQITVEYLSSGPSRIANVGRDAFDLGKTTST